MRPDRRLLPAITALFRRFDFPVPHNRENPEIAFSFKMLWVETSPVSAGEIRIFPVMSSKQGKTPKNGRRGLPPDQFVGGRRR
jgi:hypothetical protein